MTDSEYFQALHDADMEFMDSILSAGTITHKEACERLAGIHMKTANILLDMVKTHVN